MTVKSAAFLLDCWDNRGRVKYAGHGSQIGSGWEKLKYPFTDYRILSYLDTVTRIPSVRRDARVRDMTGLLMSKRDAEGRFRPESTHRAWSGFDFGQKRQPSRWIALLAHRIALRVRG